MKYMKLYTKILIPIIFALLAIIIVIATIPKFPKDYGVYLGVNENLEQFSDTYIVVVDAQYFSANEIKSFVSKGHKVYSYINIGSLENYRDYYSRFEDLTLDEYEHWDEEKWIDVSSEKWQDFILNELAPSLLDKGISGFFVDNTDVYYQYQNDDILNGLATIMKGLKSYDKDVIINGGDVFMDSYTQKLGSWDDVITGINQESVFSYIDWDNNSFGIAEKSNREYFENYIKKYSSLGADIFIIEYTNDSKLMDEISHYCKKQGFHFYITDSVELSNTDRTSPHGLVLCICISHRFSNSSTQTGL